MTTRPSKVPSSDEARGALIIETARHTAGIAVRERRGYRFYAAHALFRPLDNRSFRGLRDLCAAIDRVGPPSATRKVLQEGG